MSSYQICTTCRHRLTQIRPSRPLQWVSRATFISLGGSKPRTTTDEATGTLGEDVGTKRDHGPKWGRSNVAERLPPRSGNNNPADMLESLFEQTLTPPAPSADPEPPESTFSLEPYQHAETLKKMLAGPSIGDSWLYFVEHFGPDVWSRGSPGSRSMPSYLHSIAKQLLRQTKQAKARDPFSKTLPSVSEVSWVYLKLGLLHGSDWTDMLLVLMNNILKAKSDSAIGVTQKDRLILDLLGAWNVICRPSRPTQLFPVPDDPSSFDWSDTPRVSAQNVIQAQRKGGPLASFGLIAPLFPMRNHLNSMPLVATASHLLFEQVPPLDKSIVFDAGQFYYSLRNSISGSGYDLRQLFSEADGPGVEAVSDFVMKEWPLAKAQLLGGKLRQETPPTSTQDEQTGHIPDSPNRGYKSLNMSRRLEVALAQKDVAYVDSLWASVLQLPVSHQADEAGPYGTLLTAKLCNQFIMIYMGLRNPNRAIDVWNHMVTSKLSPNNKTWNSMLNGCKFSKDRDALESIWNNLQASQVKPDIHCWTTRISGLIECGRPDLGLKALNDMGRLWQAANGKKGKKKSTNVGLQAHDAVKPTVETVNATISGLLKKRKEEYAYQVLAWAGSMGIAPDIVTFNILLRPLVQAGNTEQVAMLLRQMKASGIQADEITFTIILDETFRSIGEQAPEEQIKTITSAFNEMAEAGMEASVHTYSTVLYQILRGGSNDMTAVNAVLDHMSSRGTQVSSHIYTMLIEHYFAFEAPNLDIVRGLIDSARSQPGSTDNVFWDRVIEGYARVGETGIAMRHLGRIYDQGNSAGWYTLRTLLSALVENQEWELARTLVNDTQAARGGPIAAGEKGKEGQHQFWQLAGELGLVDV